MGTVRHLFAVFLVALLTASLVSGNVYAAAFEIVSCKDDGTVNKPTGGGISGFFDVTRVIPDKEKQKDASGHEVEVNAGCANLTEAKIFSNIVCNFVSILNEVLGVTYCGLQHGLMPVLSVILTLYICLFGLQVLIGMAQFSGGEVLMRLLKIAAVWAFASQGAWGVGMLYKFFIGFSLQGINWVLSSTKLCVMSFCPQDILDKAGKIITPAASTKVAEVFKTIDEQIYGIIAGVKDGAGELAGGLFSGNQELITFFISLSIIAMPLYMMLLTLLWLTLKIFARSMISFLMGIAGVALLIALSPIFLSCMLFKTTTKLFETWLSYIISFSVQPVITFAILAIWLSVTSQFMGFTTDLSNTLVLPKKVAINGPQATPDSSVAFCPLEYSEDSKTFFSGIIGSLISKDDGPRIKCKGDIKKDDVDSTTLIVPSKMIEDSRFLYFLTYHLVTLLVIGYAFSNIIDQASTIADELAGAVSSGSNLGSGFGGGPSISDLVSKGGGEGGGKGTTSKIANSFMNKARAPTRRR
jgi:hypothetical protein